MPQLANSNELVLHVCPKKENQHIFKLSYWVVFKNVSQQEKKKKRLFWKVFIRAVYCGVPAKVRMFEPNSESEEVGREVEQKEEEVLNPANPAVLNLCLSAPEEERELEHCEPVTATRAPPAASASLHFLFSLKLREKEGEKKSRSIGSSPKT